MFVRRPLALLAAVSALAAWLDFSRLQQSHHADSLVSVLVGLTSWTPFFWGQDRFGMLVPLLALPVKSPGAHLLVHGFLVIALSAWGLILLVRTLLPRHLPWASPAALFLALLLLRAPPEERFNVLWAQPYALSFGLALSGVALLHRPGALRLGVAAPLFLAAAWVNVGVAVVVGPLLLWRGLLVDAGFRGLARLRFLVAGMVMLGLATACSAYLSQAVPAWHTPTDLAPWSEWRGGAWSLLGNAWGDRALRAWAAAGLACAALGVCALASARVRASARPVLVAAAGLACTAAAPFAVAAASRWVALNGHAVRYLLPSLLLLVAACCLLATLPLLALPPDHRAVLTVASVAAVGVATLVSVGPPSLRAVESAFDSRWGAQARDVIAARATHVTGDYWQVWPTVFYASWLLGRQEREKWPYGLSDRSAPTLAQARAVALPRVASLDGSRAYIGLLGLHRWTVIERRPTCLIIVTGR